MKAGLLIRVNYVNNYMKLGAAAGNQASEHYVNACCSVQRAQIFVPPGNVDTAGTSIVDSNVTPFLVGAPTSMAPITTTDATTAYSQVIADAGDSKQLNCTGNWISNYDAVDTRVISDVSNGTGQIINDPADVGGWPALAAGIPCVESLHDGIPDQWKAAMGLSTTDPTLANTTAPNGYTYLENYLNGAAQIARPLPPTNLGATAEVCICKQPSSPQQLLFAS